MQCGKIDFSSRHALNETVSTFFSGLQSLQQFFVDNHASNNKNVILFEKIDILNTSLANRTLSMFIMCLLSV